MLARMRPSNWKYSGTFEMSFLNSASEQMGFYCLMSTLLYSSVCNQSNLIGLDSATAYLFVYNEIRQDPTGKSLITVGRLGIPLSQFDKTMCDVINWMNIKNFHQYFPEINEISQEDINDRVSQMWMVLTKAVTNLRGSKLI